VLAPAADEPLPEVAVAGEGDADIVADGSEAVVAVDKSGANVAAAAPVAEQPTSEPEAAQDAALADTTATASTVEFRPEEWATFYQLVSGFDKAVSFRQIFTALRDARNDKQLNRTNLELETMIKQAINDDKFERSGRGARITYRLQNRFRTDGSGEASE
jgi:hypothetical protein